MKPAAHPTVRATLVRGADWHFVEFGVWHLIRRKDGALLGKATRLDRYGGRWVPEINDVAIGPAVGSNDEAQRAVEEWLMRQPAPTTREIGEEG